MTILCYAFDGAVWIRGLKMCPQIVTATAVCRDTIVVYIVGYKNNLLGLEKLQSLGFEIEAKKSA